MKKLLVIGANGQLGQDILKEFKHSFNVIPSYHNNLDITDFKKVKHILKQIRPQIIINTAAYHKVDEIESNLQKAFLVNAIAPQNIAKVANEINSTVVHISTDYVFGQDINRKKPYHENNRPGPINSYGLTKLAGEHMIKMYASKYFIIRTCGLFGTSGFSQKGENFVERMINLGRTKHEIRVVKDQILSPTYIVNFAQNLHLLLKTNNFGVYHMVSEGSCSWWRFTKELFELLRIKKTPIPVDSNFFKTVAKRPKYSVLENSNLKKLNLNKMNHWKINLKSYLLEKNYL